MADPAGVRISQLPVAEDVEAADGIPIIDASASPGATKRATVAQVAAAVAASAGLVTTSALAAEADARSDADSALDVRLDALELDPTTSAAVAAVADDLAAHEVAADPHGDRAHAAALVDDLSGVTNPAAARTALGLGTAATRNTGLVAGTVPLVENLNLLTTAKVTDWWGSPTASRTFAVADANTTLACRGGVRHDVVIPSDATAAIPRGSFIRLHGVGSGHVRVLAEAGVTVTTPTGLARRLARPGSVAWLEKLGPDRWALSGDLMSAVDDDAWALIESAELALVADFHDGGHLWPNVGKGGAALDAQIGSTAVVNGGCYVGNGALNLNGVNNNFALAPDSAALDVSGDLTIAMRVALATWSPAADQILISKFLAGAISYAFIARPGGLLRLIYSPDGTTQRVITSTIPVGRADGESAWIMVNRVRTTGLTEIFVAPDSVDEPSTWTTVGSTTISAGETIFQSTTNLGIGAHPAGTTPMSGSVRRAIIRTGVTTVFDADFTKQPDGTTSFIEDSPNKAVVTVNSTNIDTADPTWIVPHPTETYVACAARSYQYIATPGPPMASSVRKLDVRLDFSMPSALGATQILASDGSSSAANSAYRVYTNGGAIRIEVSDGTVWRMMGSVNYPAAPNERWQFRAQVDFDTGMGVYQRRSPGADLASNDGWTTFYSPTTPAIAGTSMPTSALPRACFGSYGTTQTSASTSTIYDMAVIGDGVVRARLGPIGAASQSSSIFTAADGSTATIIHAATGNKTLVVPSRSRGGRSVLQGDGIDDFLVAPDDAQLRFAATDKYTMLVAFRMWSAPAANLFLLGKAGGGAAGSFDMQITAALGVSSRQGAASFNASAGVIRLGSVELAVNMSDRSTVSVGRVGATLAKAADTGAVLDENNSLFVMKRLIGSHIPADLLSVLIFRRALSDAELEQIRIELGAAA